MANYAACIAAALANAPPTASRIPAACSDALIEAVTTLMTVELQWDYDSGGPSPLSWALRAAIPAGASAGDWLAGLKLIINRQWRALAERPVPTRAAATQARHVAELPSMAQRTPRDAARYFLIAGNDRKAMTALGGRRDSPGEDPVRAIARLFPPEPLPTDQPAPADPPDADLASDHLRVFCDKGDTDVKDLVAKSLKRFPRLTNPGPSGLRPEYLRTGWHCQSPLGPPFRAALVHLVEGIVCGRVRGAAVTQSTLALIPKPDGTLRPIGMGEVLRRIAGRIVMAIATPALAPTMAAEGQHLLAQHGAAIAYRRVRNAAAAGHWVLQLDMRNAFNEVTRAAVMTGAPTHPILGPLISTLYGTPSPMVAPRTGTTFMVDRGVVQGCPLGSLLFATALAPAARQAAVGLPVEQVWYADDGHIIAESHATLAEYFARFQALCSAMGLTINEHKSCVLRPALAGASSSRALERLREVDEITCLGGPVCGRAHPAPAAAHAAAWDALAQRSSDLVLPIGQLTDPQYIVRLLASGGMWSRVRYHSVCRGQMPHELAARMDDVERSVLMQALPPSALPLDGGSAPYQRAITPRAQGGIGLVSVLCEATSLGDDGVRMIDALARGDAQAASLACELMLSKRKAAIASRFALLRADCDKYTAAVIDDLGVGRGTTLLSAHVRPSDGTLLSPALARAWMALLLGVPFVDPQLTCATRACKEAHLGAHGLHALVCSSIAAARHNRVRDVLASMMRRVLPRSAVVVESALGPDGEPQPSNGGDRPIDFGFLADGVWSLYDIVFTAVQPPEKRVAGSRMAAHARSLKRAQQPATVAKYVSPLAMGGMGGVDCPSWATVQRVAAQTGQEPTYVLSRMQAAAWVPVLRALVSATVGRTPDAARLLGPHRAVTRRRRPVTLPRPTNLPFFTAEEEVAQTAPALGDSSVGAPDVFLVPPPSAPGDLPARKRRRPALTYTPVTGPQGRERALKESLCVVTAIWAVAKESRTSDVDNELLNRAIRSARCTMEATFLNWGNILSEVRESMKQALGHHDPRVLYGCSKEHAVVAAVCAANRKKTGQLKSAGHLRQWIEASHHDLPSFNNFLRIAAKANARERDASLQQTPRTRTNMDIDDVSHKSSQSDTDSAHSGSGG